MVDSARGGSVAEIADYREPDVVETDDGGAIVRTGEAQAQQRAAAIKFYDNLVPLLNENFLTTLATRLIDDIERDKKSRERRDKEYEEAIKRTGLGKEAPGGAEFDGASRAVHPVTLEAAVDFAAQAIKEIFPGKGPVKIFIPGKDIDRKRLEKADRKKELMNYQFTVQMPEFRSELDQMLPQVGLNGSQYFRLTPDMTRKRMRPTPQFVPKDMISLPYSATSWLTAERQTYHEPVTRWEFEARVKARMYHYNLAHLVNPQLPELTKAQQASNKVEGKSETEYYNVDGLRIVHECSTFLNIDGEFSSDAGEMPEAGFAPYIVCIDASTRKIVRLVRNWEEDDEDQERMQWIVEFGMVPWRGAETVGLNQMVGSLAGSATGALRALLDSAHVNNIPTLLHLKGLNFAGQNTTAPATGLVAVEGGVANGTSADIRSLVMPVPFNPPNPVLFELLGFCVDAAKGVVRTTFDDLSENDQNMPVGTVLALIEQGMKVTSAIHLRLYHSMTQVINILHRLNKMYLTDEEIKDHTGQVLALAADFDGPVDCIPTADPEVFSDVQRMAQWQAVTARADMRPDLYNGREVEKRFLERTKIPDSEGLLVPEIKPEPMYAVNENAAMALGRPVAAFPEQDHLAHLQVHLDFMLSPALGQMPNILPTMMPAMLEHIKEHVVLWYVATFQQMTVDAAGVGEEGLAVMMKQQDAETRSELDKLLAAESPDVIKRAESLLAKVAEIVAAGIEQAKQFQNQPQLPTDPNKMADIAARERIENQKLADKAKDREVKMQDTFAKLSADERKEAIRLAEEGEQKAKDRLARLREIDAQETAENQRLEATLASKEDINTQDNLVAMRIAAAELAMDERTALKNGKGLNKNPQP